ncbi:MAG: ABC transporter substrate-binding protein [Defluviitaleaceae bacterium]|nr:ABC transporter substrate-binding protein [Defluviitaleaceae bacterium]MCL2273581.1 ABC transporter substrate-binding protein [Defluviitaleaceae bacterium]
MKKILFVAAVLIAAMLTLAACGGGNGGDNVTPHGTPAPTPATGVTPVPTPEPLPPPADIPEDSREAILARAGAMSAVPGTYIVQIAGARPDANILGGWTNPITNAQMRGTLGHLGTIARNSENLFFPNPIVMVDGAWPEIRDNADGSRTYTFTVYTDLRFSDGSPINASHFAADAALWVSPYWANVVPSAATHMWLYGRAPFINGEVPTLAGVRLYNDSQFSVTARAEDMPQVWEAAVHMGFGAVPTHMYGVEIHDNGDGVFFTGPGGIPLTIEAFEATIQGGAETFVQFNDPTTGLPMYNADGEPVGETVRDGVRFRPTVTAGAYMFDSVDVGNGTISVVANPHFPGTWDGYRPRIERIIWRHVPTELMIDALAAGEVHILTAESDGGRLDQAFEMLVNAGSHSFVNFEQFGQRMIQFHTDTGPTQFREVRQAIAFMIDRHEINTTIGRGYSTVAHGPWAPAWWWYQEAADRDLYDRVHIYDLNLARAIQLLEAGGWNYNADGTPYVGNAVDNPNNIRHKWVDERHLGTDEHGNIVSMVQDEAGELSHRNWVYTGERVLMPLIINMVTANVTIPGRDALVMQMAPNLAYAGGRFVDDRDDRWSPRLSGGYRETPRYEMFYLGIGMGNPWMPWWNMGLDTIPHQNWGQVDCPTTRELAERFRVIDIGTPEGHDAFIEAFIDYMEHLTYEVFTLPVRMALVHDFFPVWLGNYYGGPLWAFDFAVIRTYDMRHAQ